MKMIFTNEEELKSELKKGNEKALSYLMDTYHQPLCLYVYSLSNDSDSAKDIVQNIFIRLWEKRNKTDGIISIKRFLYKCCYNEFINQYRKDKKILAFEVEHVNALEELIKDENEALLKRQIELLKKEIQNLPPRCKKTFLLSKEDGLSNMEIAHKMDVTIKTVEGQITKAFKILRSKLGDQINPVLFLLFNSKKFNPNIF
ncbi:RNA polymerase sigma factor [Cellulophaga fucicola]|uniref:RNA polymerase sigma-70 factor, ECF subfamily n=1 Tax=Cellulophaga fucicola TaxID=76595 RepID=A0A1K1N0F2_9FLAO|nr:sigma-70 family RNA polymerase sigma factor [Cellulophaga fucicola]SFW28725.1 RNA polymerase sigma-70 factor, ECF subfamily [Cellulophaga fucicola]